MRGAFRRASSAWLALILVAWPVLVSASNASAQSDPGVREVLLVRINGATLEDVLATPGLLALAQRGGAALVVMTNPGDPLGDLSGDLLASSSRGPLRSRFKVIVVATAVAGGDASPEGLRAAAVQLESALAESTASQELVMLASDSSTLVGRASGGHIGVVVLAQGSPHDLASAMQAAPATIPPKTLTSDSTRRDGVVTSTDLAETALAFAQPAPGLPDPGGAQIRVVDAPLPIDLLERYVQSKRLTVPIGTAAALFVTFGGLVAVLALLWRRSPRGLRSLMAWIAIASPFLALSLLLVGHLPSLTYAGVIPFLIATAALAAVALVPIARRWGTLAAIASAGTLLLVALVVEGVLGWNAALTPLLGGSQLDGGRYFGVPNAFIGLLLGGSVYVAQRLSHPAGAVLIAATGLFAGSPWTGSNIGAAVTLFAAAGIWWGLDRDLSWWRTAAATGLATLAGTGLVVAAHRYLTSSPTHITRFAEHTGGLSGVWSKVVDRLGVGTHLIAANPFALVPVVGVLGTLFVVLRPPAPVRITFDEAPVWRTALLTILIGSIVAYLVNDSGAAAIGEGFTAALGGLLYVSLLRRNGIMETS
ncbi:MAG: hypothetical protein ACRDH7_08995 [Actinomycetota bacterium]